MPALRLPLRARAALIHLLFTLLIGGVIVATVVWLWFPGDYLKTMGGVTLLYLVLGCDVVLGPLLSLVVCDPAKPRRTLMIDYAVIVAVQLAALVYGVSVVAESRPVFTVFAIDRFNIVSAFEVERKDLRANGGPAPFEVSWTGPVQVGLQLPKDTAGRNAALDLELSGGELHVMPRYYVGYDVQAVLAKAQPLATLVAKHASAAGAAQRVLDRHGLAPEQVVWLPVVTRLGFGTAVLAQRDGALLGFLGLDPY
jgi:hypothetical protein